MVANMTAGEALSAEKCRNYMIIMVWDHKTVSTRGSARIAIICRECYLYKTKSENQAKLQDCAGSFGICY